MSHSLPAVRAEPAVPRGERLIAETGRTLELELERGRIEELRLGYERIGNPDAPTLVVLGGISAQAHVCAHDGDPRDGWWERLVGGGRILDTGAFNLIGMDWVGGPGNSSAPPARADELAIPAVTTGDQARALGILLDHLGIERVRAVVGASYGAMVALAFGAFLPERADRVVAISGAHRSHPMATALRALQRQIAILGAENGDLRRGLVLARSLAMTTYRSAEEFDQRFAMEPVRTERGFRFEVESYLQHQGETFADRFDLAHFLCLCQSLDLHRIEPGEIRAPTTLVAVREDTLVPLWQMRKLAEGIAAPVELIEVDSPYGHDAFLVEDELIGIPLARTLMQVPADRQQPSSDSARR